MKCASVIWSEKMWYIADILVQNSTVNDAKHNCYGHSKENINYDWCQGKTKFLGSNLSESYT